MDAIQQARQRGATDDQILNNLLRANPAQAINIDKARARGANSTQIIDEMVKQNTQVQSPGFLQKVGGVVQKIFPGQKIGEGIGTSVAALGRLAKGDQQGFRDILETQVTPKEIAGDVAKSIAFAGAAGVSPAMTVMGKAAQFGTLGAVSGAGQAATESKSGTEIAREAVQAGAVGAGVGVAFGLAEKGFKALSNLLGKTGTKMQTAVIKPTQADIKDGFKIETVNKYNLGGSLKQTFEKTDAKLDELAKELNTKLAANKTPVDLSDVYEKTAKRVLGSKFESFGANAQIESAIDKLRGEIANVAGQNGLVSIPEAQIVKRASGHFGAWNFGVPTPEVTAQQKVYNTFYNELKTAIEKASPDGVGQINKQISELIPVMNALIRRIPVAERSATLSLTDIITLTGAAFEPRALGLSLLNLASKSGRVGAALSKTPQVSIGGVEPLVRTATTGTISQHQNEKPEK